MSIKVKKNTTQKKPVKSRRDFLKLGAGSAATLASASLPGLAAAKNTAFSDKFKDQGNRQLAVARIKITAANRHLHTSYRLRKQKINNDEKRYSSKRFFASFSKTLPCNSLAEVQPSAFRKLRYALRKGNSSLFDLIPLDKTAQRKLANPQGAFRYPLIGIDGHATRIAPSHSISSPEIAGEMTEVYWQALTRDIPFIDYATSSAIGEAIDDLNALSASPGEQANGPVSVATIFRGETRGDLIGPYISQFLLKDFNFGPVNVVQRYETGTSGVDYMLDKKDWLNIQRGGSPLELASFDVTPRYIYNNRSLAEYVHRDVSFQAYLHAALILLSYGQAAWDKGNPYPNLITNQGAFTAMGPPFVLDMLTKAANLSLNGAWFQKWLHLFLRPEALAGRVHYHLGGERDYELHRDLLNCKAVSKVQSKQGNALLPMAYIEGSPTHPSYPAGHATIAGACVTVLKAFFDEDFVIPNPVQANDSGDALLKYDDEPLTVGNELNKLANNISIGRNAAGVHYRQDGIQGMIAGEQQAISLLQDYSTTLNEEGIAGFSLKRFDGSSIIIRNGNVIGN